MKKVLVVLFLIISSLAFGEWELYKPKDDFGDESGAVSVVYPFDKPTPVSFTMAHIGIHKPDKKTIVIYPSKYIGVSIEQKTLVKFKIDDKAPIEFKGKLVSAGEGVAILEKENKEKFNQLVQQMVDGKEFKISIRDFAGNNILEKGDLENFKELYPKIKSKNK